MSAKMGRPKLDNPITKHLSVRVDQETYKAFLCYCEKHNISQGEAIRRAIALLTEA